MNAERSKTQLGVVGMLMSKTEMVNEKIKLKDFKGFQLILYNC